MKDQAAMRLFFWADRAFWLIWLGFPVLIWVAVRGVLTAPEQLAVLAPDQAACLAGLPLVVNFSPVGRAVFWSGFAIEFAIFAILLLLAHRVIHRCAMGEVFVLPMIGSLRLIGTLIALFPLLDLAITNLSMLVYVAIGDIPVFEPNFALDVTVIGMGLLMVVMAAAMRMAVRLHRDAELTI